MIKSLLSIIAVGVLSAFFLYGTWKNEKETLIIGKDTIRVVSPTTSVTSAWRQDKRTKPKRIYLLFDFGDSTLEMPFAIYEVHGDTLRMEKTAFEGVNVDDYCYIPFPKNFTNKQWVFIKEP